MTLAVIKTGGKQYLVTEGKKLKVEKIDYQEGQEFEIKDVLLVADDKDIRIGQPNVEEAKVLAKVLRHGRKKKKIVFRFRPKVRYKKKKSHRQWFSEIEILKILYS
jgi:large subunit ribosomal protein L21